MTLTVLNVAYALSAVGSVGGAEQVLGAIDRALVAAGGRSIVVACEGSRVRGTLHATPRPRGVIDDAVRAAAQAAHARAIEAVLATHDVDVVHFHGVDFHAYLPRAGVPTLATLHLPPSWYPHSAVAPTRAHTYVHCVSESQHRACPPSAALLPPIPNGVRIPARSRQKRHRHGVVALGRICPEKGFHIALDAARRARVPLTLAGRVFPYPAHLAYWAREIAPRLDERRRFVGPVRGAACTTLLQSARCVVIPSLVPETSSLVAMEALAAGTPVVAFAAGALAEIVENGVTGYLVSDEREMAEAIRAADAIDPRACRAAAESRFSVAAMTARYLERYERLAATHARRDPARGARRLPIRIAPAQRDALDATAVTTTQALEQLAPEWRRLAGIAGATPFQRPEWLLPWWRHFGTAAPAAVALRRRGELVGVLPLYVRHDPNGERVLALMGTGNSDYVDVLAHPAHRDAVAAAFVSRALDSRDAWDRCDLGPLPAGSALLEAPARAGGYASIDPIDVCPVLALRGATRDDAGIPARFLAQLRYAERRLTREHEVRIETADASSASALLDALFALHDARWHARGAPGVFADSRTRAFHHDVVAATAAQDSLRLHVMRVDGTTAAAFYGFGDAKRLYYYVGGFDPARARHSVGSLVILHAIDAAASRGAVEVDFLHGAEAYKYRWGATDRHVYAWRMRSASAESEAA